MVGQGISMRYLVKTTPNYTNALVHNAPIAFPRLEPVWLHVS